MSAIKYPVGIQTFSKIREGGYLYVDKTASMFRLVNSTDYVFLSRPRRFGKSLLVSTIDAYFSGRKELFRGLEIEKLEDTWTAYPVLRLDLSGENYTDCRKMIETIGNVLEIWEEQYGGNPDKSISWRFETVIRNAYLATGHGAVILIDEYDKPMLDTLHDEVLHGQLRDELRAFYSVLKKCDQYIRFAMLTGVTRFSKVSVFSGLNNLKDISMLPRYETICGISENEFRGTFGPSVREFAANTGLTEEEVWTGFRKRYDGYRFSERGERIYNPFSVLNAFDDSRFGSYWFATGTSSFLIKLLSRQPFRIGSLEGARRREGDLSDITDMERDVVPLMYQAGYLTIKEYDSEAGEYILGFPNREVSEGFWSSLANYFFHKSDAAAVFNIKTFVEEIKSGDAEKFLIRLRSLFSDTNSEYERDKEIHFQNMMAIVFKLLGFEVSTEVHSARGRCDLIMKTDCFIYIMEFKVDASAESALRQIKERGYAESYAADVREKILVGVNFSTAARTIDDWRIERI